LTEGSPCIDTGDPYIGDADGSRSDMGATGGGFVRNIPRIEVDDAILVGMSTSFSLSIRNTGGAELEISDLTLPTAFSTEMTFPQTVTPGETLSVPITYTPSGADDNGVAVVAHNDEYQSPREVYLATGTTIFGDIATTTWTAANSPYRITNGVAIPSGNTLTIEAGVDVVFDADVQFVVEGAIHARGTETDSVRFIKGISQMWRGLRISGGDSSSFAYARISDGNARGDYPDNNGGGVYVSGSETRVSLTNCTISGNSAMNGGGLYNTATVTLTNCVINGNTSYEEEGTSGIGNYKAAAPTNGSIYCAISGIPPRPNGGGFFNYGTATLTNCTISGNDAIESGGLRNAGIVTLTNCTISGNTASYLGGGISNKQLATLTNCTISGNTASYYGGGIHSYNDALGYTYTGSTTLKNCTVSGNAANNGGGIYNSSFMSATLTNCIFWSNTATNGPQVSNNSGTTTVRYSDIQDGIPEGVIDGGGNISADPLFVDAANGDFSLSEGSPCIDAGDPDSPPDPDETRVDMGVLPYDMVVRVSTATPVSFTLAQNAPNPFNPTTTIRFGLSEPGPVSLTVYDVNGRFVRGLVDDYRTAGMHEVVWDARDDTDRAVASGVYVYRLTAGADVAVRRMVLVR